MALNKMLILIVVLNFSCNKYSLIELDKDSNRNRALLIANIPIGSPKNFAQQIMKANDFICELIEKGEFMERKNIDFLYCNRYDVQGFLVNRRWLIAIILNANKVEDILTSTGLIGP